MNATLPRLDACLDLYRTAYDQHGSAAFTKSELDWDHPESDRDHIVNLAVAYGLLTTDGTVYTVTCEPGDSEECWKSAIEERTQRVRQALTTHTSSGDDHADSQSLSYEGEEYASVQVEDGDDFAAVVETVSDVNLGRWDGVVLRAPGDYANEVQRFADRLGDPTELSDMSLSTPLQKEFSDVEGSSKDTLEFRLFLSSP